MKKTKKLWAFLLAMIMVLSMSMTVFAAVTPADDRITETDGSVIVNNAKEKQTYTLYLLFKADMGANDAITYTANGVDLTDNKWFELNSNGFVVAKQGTSEDWAKDPEAIAWVKTVGTKMTSLDSTDASSTGWTGLEYGYYFVDTTLGAFVGIDSANKEAKIQEKNEEPTIDKEIVNTTNGFVGNDSSKSAEADQGKNEAATAQVGDTVTYKLTVAAKPGAENYIVTDTLSDGLTAPAAEYVVVTGLTKGTDYTVKVEGQIITVTFMKTYLDTIAENTDIVITYPAVVNANAVIGENGNPNSAKLEYGHNSEESTKPGNETPPDDAMVYVAKITLTKTDDKGVGLAGAEFALKNAEGKYYKFSAAFDENPAKVEWVDKVEDATTFTSDENGAMNGEFTGLSNGSYTLEEITVPDGYNEIDPEDPSLKFKILDNDYTDNNLIQKTTVVNNAGTVLPSTGGVGTTMFYVVGGALVLVAVVLLVTRKRMNVEK